VFDTLLIANRGEIACRIMRTADELGLRTVAVFEPADKDALHVESADIALPIGSYLDGAEILAAAEASGAQAIHPGYGFLAENAGFATACAEAGLIFVGPPVAALESMGTKAAAKGIMEAAGVPVVPGYYGEEQTLARFQSEAEAIGYPVLLKASSGGGGKGMRRVDAPEALEAALEAARRESLKAFGDDRMLVEKYILSPRHIEVQVFADQHGNVVHLFERECSIQRRYQKVVEESPAPGLDDALRAQICQAAVDAARAVGYQNAGTVEFILDASGAFFFMEMNTRLQVEHPVTEMVLGVDLVAWQLDVAAGCEFPMRQEDIEQEGHSIEVRIYAEDPQRDFLPAIGALHHLRWPEESEHVRIDTGVREGDRVTIHFDPMLAKLIVWDLDRESAILRLQQALQSCQIAGLVTNVAFLLAVAELPAFSAGEIDTGFIQRHEDMLLAPTPPDECELALAALALMCDSAATNRRAQAGSSDPHSPWGLSEGFRLNESCVRTLEFEQADIRVRTLGPGRYQVGDVEISGQLRGRELRAWIDGQPLRATTVLDGNQLTLFLDGASCRLTICDPLLIDHGADLGGGGLTAPMPGKVIQVMVSSGDRVVQGDPLLVLEAMKMEQTIVASSDGEVAAVFYAVGDQVEEGAVLVDLQAG